MPSPKKSELLRRVLLETAGVYTRISATEKGWKLIVDNSENKVKTFEEPDIERVSEKVIDFIVENREESTGKKKKKFTFTAKPITE